MMDNSKIVPNGFLPDLSGGVTFGKGGFNPIWIVAALAVGIVFLMTKK